MMALLLIWAARWLCAQDVPQEDSNQFSATCQCRAPEPLKLLERVTQAAYSKTKRPLMGLIDQPLAWGTSPVSLITCPCSRLSLHFTYLLLVIALQEARGTELTRQKE